MSSAVEFEQTPETARGRLLYKMLLAVHAQVRGELTRVERLAAAVADGLSAEGLDRELEELRSTTLLWQFQVSCLRYCRFVHLHHHAEDTQFFDELQETNPALRPVVERLRADHREVSHQLDAVEAAARALTDADSAEARRAVADALHSLQGHLLAHLDHEERGVAATTRRLRDLSLPHQRPEAADGNRHTKENDHERDPRT
jgi:predicted nuclease with TOPRIM domain